MGLHVAGVKSGSPDTGLCLWHGWNQGSAEKFPGQHDLIGQWRSLKAGDGVPLGTLFKLAKDVGWTRPAPDSATLFSGVTASREIPCVFHIGDRP